MTTSIILISFVVVMFYAGAGNTIVSEVLNVNPWLTYAILVTCFMLLLLTPVFI